MEKSVLERMIQKQFCTENGNIVYWKNRRSNQESALIFLHGLCADHTLFEKQISYFEKCCKIICWDAPAHGKSRPYSNFSYYTAAKQLKGILEQENIQKAVFVGQSMGGYVCQTFLKYYAEFAVGFIGIDTTPFGLDYYSNFDIWCLRQIGWMTRCYPYKILVKAIARSSTCTKYAYENMMKSLLKYSKKEICHLMEIYYSGFFEENCDLVPKVPVLILVGEKDRTGKVKKYCQMWHEKTGYPLSVIKSAAHNSNIDNYEQVNFETAHFIQNLKI